MSTTETSSLTTTSTSDIPNQPALSKKDKDAEFERWLELTRIEDVKINEGDRLVFIMGVNVSKITMKVLRRFCVKYSISGYKNKTIEVTWQLIVEHVKGRKVDKTMYKEDDDSDNDDDSGDGNSGTDNNNQKC